jgi:hypothetical protein
MSKIARNRLTTVYLGEIIYLGTLSALFLGFWLFSFPLISFDNLAVSHPLFSLARLALHPS